MIICKTPTLEVFCICYLHDVNNILQCMCLVSYLRINMCHQLPQNVAKAHQSRRRCYEFFNRYYNINLNIYFFLFESAFETTVGAYNHQNTVEPLSWFAVLGGYF